MLNKLLKYEIQATARLFLPLYIVLLAYSVIHKVIFYLNPIKWQIPEFISLTVYAMILAGISVMTLVVVIQRFYKNLLSDEGYLMFTLPIKPWKLIISKLVVSMLWTISSAIVAILSIIIVSYSEFFIMGMQDTRNLLIKFFSNFGPSSALFTVEIVVFAALSLVSGILMIYVSIAIGQLFNSYRILSSLGAFIAINTVSQIILTVIGVIGASLPVFKKLASQTQFPLADPLFHLGIWFAIIITGLFTAGYFVLTNYILNKRLNLE